jgi:hypothetical protein
MDDLINVGAFLIGAMWMLLLAWWPALTGAAALALLAVFGLAGRQHRRGIAAVAGGALMVSALGLSALRWLPDGEVLPHGVFVFAQLLLVPAPLIVLFVAVTLMQALLRPTPRGQRVR